MLTIDEIRNVEFSRGRGYHAEEVDDFIDACTETVEQLIREKQELSDKLKVLADKIVEYRNDEDNIRAALLNAQRAGDTVVREAEDKAKAVLETAQREADDIRRVALDKIEDEKRELERMQREVASFKARMMTLYKEHIELITALPEPEKTEEEPAAEPIAEPEAEEEDIIIAPAAEEVAVAVPETEEVKPLSRFNDLKFGNDYDIREDTDDDDDKPARKFLKKRK